MSKIQTNYDEFQDEYLNTVIKLAIKYGDTIEAQADIDAEKDVPTIDEARKNAVWAMAMEKYTMMKTAEKEERRPVPLRRPLSRMIHVAACLILVLGIAAPIAIANVEAIRVKVMELLIDIQKDHTELQFVENIEAEFYVPTEWKGCYYPTYIPNNFILDNINMLGDEIMFVDENNNHISFGEYTEDDLLDINSENANVSYSAVNGSSAFIVTREECVILTWSTDDKFFVINAEAPVEEVLSMAKSVKKILK